MTSRSNTTRVSGHVQFRILIVIGIFALGINTALAQSPMPTVPDGFTIHVVTAETPALYVQDVEPGPGGDFGTYLYVIVYPNKIYRVNPWGGTLELFTTVPDALLSSLRFGFDGDLFAVDGQLGSPSTVYRIKADGSSSVFSTAPPLGNHSSEGMAYSPGGAFGNRLFISEFNTCDVGGSPVYAIEPALGVRSLFARLPCGVLTGLEFGFGADLFGIFTYTGDIYRIAASGVATKFNVIQPIGGAETLAFGSASNLFGEYLYVAKDDSGEIHRIGPNGQSSVFASGFQGFSTGGVTGLKFSPDKRMLFVTDDLSGKVYAITFPTLSCVGFDAPLDAGPVRVNKNRALPFKARLFDADGTAITGLDLGTGSPVIQVTFQPTSGPASDVTADAVPVGLGTTGNQFEFVEDEWRFNLSTKGFTAAGTYVVTMAPGNSYFIRPTCTASFVVR